MKRMRLRIFLLVTWLLALFNVERLDVDPSTHLNLASFVYVLAAAAAILFLLVPLRRWQAYAAGAGLLAGYALIKLQVSPAPLLGGSKYVTLAEAGALAVTALLAWLVSQDLDDFVQAVEAISMPEGRPDLLAYEQVEERLQDEIERARRYQRPFSIAMIELDPATYDAALHRTIREAQMAMIGRYVQMRFGMFLSRHIRQTDLLAHDARQRRFLLLAPENPLDQTVQMLGRLERTIEGQMGVRFRYSVADFPGMALTSEELLRRVTEALRFDTQAPDAGADSIQLPKPAGAGAYPVAPDGLADGRAESPAARDNQAQPLK